MLWAPRSAQRGEEHRAWSVRVLLAALTASIAIPVMIVAGIAVWRANVAEQIEMEQRIASAARALSIDLDRELTQFMATLEVLSTSPSLRAGDLATFELQARQAVHEHDRYLLLANPEGQQVLNASADNVPTAPRLSSIEGVGEVTRTRRPYVSNLFEDPASRQPVILVLLPVIESGAVKYILAVAVQPRHLMPLVDRAPIEAEWAATVLDRNGQTVVRLNENDRWSGGVSGADILRRFAGAPRGVATMRGEDGNVLLGWSRSSISDWVAVVSVPEAVRRAPLRRAWIGFSVGSTALIVLSGLLALYFGREIAQPIYAMARAAASEDPFVPTRLREVNEVGFALYAATQKLRLSEARYRTLAERARDIFILLDQEGAILEVNSAAVETYGYSVEELVGQSIAILRHPSMRHNIMQQVAEAMTTGILFETLHQRKDGSVFPVEVSAAFAQLGDRKTIFSIIRDISRRVESEVAVRDREALLETVTQNVGVGLILLDMQRRYTFVNPAYADLMQRTPEDILGKTVAEVLGPVNYERSRRGLERAYAGKRVSYEYSESAAGNGSLTNGKTFQITYQPAFEPCGEVRGMTGVFVDITGPKRDAEHIRFLMRELSHRSKNLLAVIQAMARQTARTSEGLADFEARFSARIMSLARSHDLLVQQNWQGVPIVELIRSQLSPFVDLDSRVSLRGEALMLRPEAANNLGLALNELATNASKYGALSVASGHVAVAWRLDESSPRRFSLDWRESGGPPVQAPSRRGFGRHVIEKIVAAALGAQVKLSFDREGLSWSLEAPLSEITACPADLHADVPVES